MIWSFNTLVIIIYRLSDLVELALEPFRMYIVIEKLLINTDFIRGTIVGVSTIFNYQVALFWQRGDLFR